MITTTAMVTRMSTIMTMRTNMDTATTTTTTITTMITLHCRPRVPSGDCLSSPSIRQRRR